VVKEYEHRIPQAPIRREGVLEGATSIQIIGRAATAQRLSVAAPQRSRNRLRLAVLLEGLTKLSAML